MAAPELSVTWPVTVARNSCAREIMQRRNAETRTLIVLAPIRNPFALFQCAVVNVNHTRRSAVHVKRLGILYLAFLTVCKRVQPSVDRIRTMKEMRSFAVAVLLLPVAFAVGTRSDYLSIRQKFQSIEKQRVAPGTRVALPSRELNAYVQTELPKVAPQGIRNPTVELQANNVAIGRALINFVKFQNANGTPPNWIVR